MYNQASDAYLGELRLFAGMFAPLDWMFCHGQTLKVSEYYELFSALGAKFGGDGRDTFRLPDLRGRLPVGRADTPPPGMTHSYELGKPGGAYEVALQETTLPAHSHALFASTQPASQTAPGPAAMFAAAPAGTTLYAHSTNPARLPLSPDFHGPAGGGRRHDNVMPCMGISYIICVRHASFPVFD